MDGQRSEMPQGRAKLMPGQAPLRKSCAHPNAVLPSHSRNPDAGAGKGSFQVTTEDLKTCLCLFSVMPLKG